MTDDPDDIELEAELRRAVARRDPVPGDVLRRAIEGYSWRTIDAELAELTFDSLVDRDEAALVRSDQGPRFLTFSSPDLSIEMEVTGAGSAHGLVGQLLPPQPATMEIRHEAGTMTIEADDLGRFSTSSLPAGPASLRCRLADDAPTVVTDWVSL